MSPSVARYASADDVFAVCLELLRREDNDYEAKLAWLQAALDEAEGEIAAGKGIDGEQAIEQALEAYRKAARS